MNKSKLQSQTRVRVEMICLVSSFYYSLRSKIIQACLLVAIESFLVIIMENETVEVENDDLSDKKPTFKYQRLYDDGKQKFFLQKTLSFLQTWSWLLTSILLLILIIIICINHYKVSNILFLIKPI